MQEESNKSTLRKIAFEAFDFLEIFVLAAVAVLILFSAVFRLCNVDGRSMESTLHDGELLVISNFAYTPKNGDIIVFHQTSEENSGYNKPLVKRIIATEGQWIYIEYGADNAMYVYVSEDETIDESDLIEEPYVNLETGLMGYYPDKYKAQVPKGCVFAMGDHRYHSADSRDPAIGFVDARRILGKVLLRISPMDKFGAVE